MNRISTQVETWLKNQIAQQARADDIASDLVIRSLSKREIQVLQYVAYGKNNKEIAFRLGISRQTVKNHVCSIFRKLGVDNRTRAVLYALRCGYFELEELVESSSPPLSTEPPGSR